ncbi:hypothetical protein ACQKGO_33610 [Corallococcus interemptor]|uniref:hypothetical protein n=1 Tax=Corallococcus interemptor TaxID=2316720 RepID=UPI003D000906
MGLGLTQPTKRGRADFLKVMADRSREFHVERSLAEPPSNGPSRKGPHPFIRVAVRVSSLTFNADTSAWMRDLHPAQSTKRVESFSAWRRASWRACSPGTFRHGGASFSRRGP